MKKIFLLALSFFTFHLSLITFVSPVFAKVMIEEKGNVVISKSEIIDDDLFIGAENVTIEGDILGSAFVGAGQYIQTGNIKGDLVLGTGNAQVSGLVGGDIYLGAGDVSISKLTVVGNVIVGSGSLAIDKDSKINGSLIVGSGNLKNYAPVGRNVIAGAQNILLDSKVGKEVRVGGSNITLGSSTNIAGNLTYALGEDDSNLTQDPKAVIGGAIFHYIPPVNPQAETAKFKEDMRKFGMVASRGWLVISFVGSLLLSFLLLKLFPKTSLGLSTQIKNDLLRSLGIGFLIVVFAFPVLLVLSLTVIGLPLAGLLLLLLWVALIASKLVTSYALGRFITAQFNLNKTGVYATGFIGLAIFYILRAMPGIGWIMYTLFTWTGLGAIWLYTHSNLKNL